jgi:hypothetical protein
MDKWIDDEWILSNAAIGFLVFGAISAFTPGSWESLQVNFCVKRFDDAVE